MGKKQTVPDLVSVEEQPYPIPANWRWVRLGSISTNQYGFTAKAIHDSKYPLMLRITDIQNGNVDWRNVLHCEIQADEYKKFALKSDDIVIARTGATTGKSYILDNPPDSVFASYLIRLRIQEEVALPKYVFEFMQSYLYWYQISELSVGIAQPGVNSSKLSRMLFPLSPLPEQVRIVDRIESLFVKLDEARDKAQAVMDGYELRRAAILHKAFTGELTAKWREEHGVGLNSWKRLKLGEIGEIITGNTPDTKQSEYFGGNIPFIKPTELNQGRRVSVSKEYLTEAGKEVSRPVPAGTVCVCCIGATIGKCGLLTVDAVTNQQINSIIPNDFMDNLYIYFYCFSDDFRNTLIQHSHATTLPIISKGRMAKLPIPVPTLLEQEEISRILDEVFEQEQAVKASAEKVLETIDLMKKKILGMAFRGLLGTNDPAEPCAEISHH